MDRNLHTDDFERLLREKSDEFRMYPSKRIWSSIYNNIHPGRKWPSVVMSITLISSLLMIGYLNTKDSDTFTETSTNKNINNPLAVIYKNLPTDDNMDVFSPFTVYKYNTVNKGSRVSVPGVTNIDDTNNGSKNENPGILTYRENVVAATKSNKSVQSNSPIQSFKQGLLLTNNNTQKLDAKNKAGLTSVLSDSQSNVSFDMQPGTNENLWNIYEKYPNNKTVASLQITGSSKENVNVFINDEQALAVLKGNLKSARTNQLSSVKKTTISKEDKEWIDNYAMYNRPAPKKWAGKLAWEVYATPSVVYRTLTTNAGLVNLNSTAPFVMPGGNTDIENDIIQKPSFGFELGIGIQYPIFKNVKLKTGLQLNFTRYNSEGYHNTHPVATKLTMYDAKSNSTYELFRTTPYSNKGGLKEVNLHNQTFQVSVPVGLDFKILGNENIQWNVGVTVQPTYVIGGTSYLLSSDRRNYVKESSMFNRWNLNAGFETFITYKSNGITYEIGPQFRSQLFSTNKRFAIEEKLQNFGIKFGVIKTLK